MSKSFGSVPVLKEIDLDLLPGEVHGLVGENGSGKSTLVKIIGGLHSPDPGAHLSLWGRELSFPLTQPQSHGIAIIHQDLALEDTMTVAENVGISSGYGTATFGAYRKRREQRAAAALIEELGLRMSPTAIVATLPPAERSMVAIMRALRLQRLSGASQCLLILDEPTAALTQEESQRLLTMVRGLAAAGAAVLFIGHRLHEVMSVCDRLSVLRSGRLVSTLDTSQTTDAEVVELMLGYELGEFYPERHTPSTSEVALSVRDLSATSVSGVSFEVHRGEILGITGLAGMGQDELPYLVYGSAKRSAGEVVVGEREIANDVLAAQAAGVALVPGNRQRDAVWMEGSAQENLTIPFLSSFHSGGMLRKRRERTFSADQLRRFGVRPHLPGQEMRRFSGGNQQKIVLARWLHTEPDVLLLHEPTQGVDAGAKKELFHLIREAADRGTGVVIFSSDIEEVVNMCHRVIVLRHGVVSAILGQHQLTEQRIISESQGQRAADSAVRTPGRLEESS
ncbi:sugar ABC transporter ATP-binding protein [Nocardioides sp. CBS4Y-1]|uniref:Sugar ABC transporter ATP-binding protein n=2 Tax=Nocardioides acrostichi TaxID=2784339 RepID=A0A930UYN4_9ACTN|nr:sugar ABC transporter ATP-binding protein [Nocardioides acrostichi]